MLIIRKSLGKITSFLANAILRESVHLIKLMGPFQSWLKGLLIDIFFNTMNLMHVLFIGYFF